MKKKLVLLAILLFGSLFMFTGCENPDVVQRIIDATNKIESGEVELVFSMSARYLNLTIDFDMLGDMKFNKDIAHMYASTEIMGQSINMEIYSKEEIDKVITYTKDSTTNKWTKTEASLTEESIVTNYSTYLENYKEVKEIKNEDLPSGVKGYEITITKENAMALLNNASENELTENIDLIGDTTIKVYVDEKHQMKSMEIDFTNMLVPNEEIEFTNFNMKMNFKNLGQVDEIIIPEEVLNAENISL